MNHDLKACFSLLDSTEDLNPAPKKQLLVNDHEANAECFGEIDEACAATGITENSALYAYMGLNYCSFITYLQPVYSSQGLDLLLSYDFSHWTWGCCCCLKPIEVFMLLYLPILEPEATSEEGSTKGFQVH